MYYVRYKYGIKTTYTEEMAMEFFRQTKMIDPTPMDHVESHNTKEDALKRVKELKKEKYAFNIHTNAER